MFNVEFLSHAILKLFSGLFFKLQCPLTPGNWKATSHCHIFLNYNHVCSVHAATCCHLPCVFLSNLPVYFHSQCFTVGDIVGCVKYSRRSAHWPLITSQHQSLSIHLILHTPIMPVGVLVASGVEHAGILLKSPEKLNWETLQQRCECWLTSPHSTARLCVGGLRVASSQCWDNPPPAHVLGGRGRGTHVGRCRPCVQSCYLHWACAYLNAEYADWACMTVTVHAGMQVNR